MYYVYAGIIGLAGGFLSAIFGIGGGVIMVPAMMLFMDSTSNWRWHLPGGDYPHRHDGGFQHHGNGFWTGEWRYPGTYRHLWQPVGCQDSYHDLIHHPQTCFGGFLISWVLN